MEASLHRYVGLLPTSLAPLKGLLKGQLAFVGADRDAARLRSSVTGKKDGKEGSEVGIGSPTGEAEDPLPSTNKAALTKLWGSWINVAFYAVAYAYQYCELEKVLSSGCKDHRWLFCGNFSKYL